MSYEEVFGSASVVVMCVVKKDTCDIYIYEEEDTCHMKKSLAVRRYVCVFACVYVCVCVCARARACVCVCVCVCV